MDKKEKKREMGKQNRGYNLWQVIVIGVVSLGATVFGFFQLSFFNTYIEHVLELSPLHIALMVSLASITAVIFFLIVGVFSDNTRSKYGRRRPYLLLGIIAGISIIIFGYIDDYLTGLLLRILIVELGINAYYAVQRSLIADLVPLEHRGKANGIASIIATMGMMLAVGATVIANEVYVANGKLNQEGHIFLFTIGGLTIIFCALFGFFFLREPPVSELPPKKRFLEDLKDTFQIQELKKHKEYFKIIVASSVFIIGLLLVAPYLFIYIFGLEMKNIEMALMVIIIAPMIAVSMFFIGKLADKYGRKKMIVPIMLISSIGFIMVPFIPTGEDINLPLLIIAVTLALIGFNGVMVPVAAWQQDLLPEEKRGQFIAILNLVNALTAIPGAIIGALIYTYLGIQWIFAFVPIFFIASIPFFMKVEETLKIKKED